MKQTVATMVLGGLILVLSGCASEPTAFDDEIHRLVLKSEQQSNPPVNQAIQPMLGFWKVDIEATLAESSLLPAETLAAIRKDLEINPFELQITPQEYISRSSIKTVRDRYTIQSVQGNVVTIQFHAADRIELRSGRLITLQLKNNMLIIRSTNPHDLFACVLSPVQGPLPPVLK